MYNKVFNNESLISIASNIPHGENPPFNLEDFYSIYPQFKSLTEIPEEVKEMYLQFANDSVPHKKWGNQWKLGMCLFIAHFLSLYLQSFAPENSLASEVMANAQSRGLITSKSVGDVSVSYDFSTITNGINGWANWKLTAYGLQFAGIAKLMSKGGMYIW